MGWFNKKAKVIDPKAYTVGAKVRLKNRDKEKCVIHREIPATGSSHPAEYRRLFIIETERGTYTEKYIEEFKLV